MGIASAIGNHDGKLRVAVKTSRVRGFFAMGLGAGGMLGVLMAGIEILNREPRAGLELLRSWGPWALVVGFVIFVAWKSLDRFMSIVDTGVQAWVSTAERGAVAQESTADALSKLAAQNGRQAEETQRLTVYTAQEFPAIYRRFDRQDDVLEKLSIAVHALGDRLDESRHGKGEG